MAAITDKFNKAANGTGVYPSVASVTAIREQGGSILSCDDLAGWATDTAVHFSTYRLMADGTVDTTTQSDWKGIVSGNTITQITHLAGNNDNGHLVGDKVELNPTISWLDDLITGILKSYNQDGTLKDNIIQAKHIVNGAINNTKLAAKAVKSENVDFETISVIAEPTPVSSVGLNTSTKIQTLKIPTNGKWKITAQFSGNSASDGAYIVEGATKKNGSTMTTVNDNFPSVSTKIHMNFQMLDIIDANGGDTIDFCIRAVDHTISVVNKGACRLIAEKVG